MRYFLLTFCCLITLVTAKTQVAFGLKAGANLSTIDKAVLPLDGSEEGLTIYDAWKARYQAGLWVRIPVAERINVQPEVLFIEKDWYQGNANGEDAHVEMQFLSLPVLLQYEWGKLHLGVGPELTYLVGHESWFRGESTGDSNFLLQDVDFGLGVNADVTYVFGPWEVSLRYARDVTSFMEINFTNANGEPLGEVEHRFHSFQLSVGYDLLGK